jgi:hypothetical protein
MYEIKMHGFTSSDHPPQWKRTIIMAIILFVVAACTKLKVLCMEILIGLKLASWDSLTCISIQGSSQCYTFFKSTRFKPFFDVERKSKNILEKTISSNLSHFSSKQVLCQKVDKKWPFCSTVCKRKTTFLINKNCRRVPKCKFALVWRTVFFFSHVTKASIHFLNKYKIIDFLNTHTTYFKAKVSLLTRAIFLSLDIQTHLL